MSNTTPPPPHVVIIGAGPTGLGAAVRLTELRYASWTLYDGADAPGGLSSSYRDTNGFLWDVGGHVVFSHYAYFDDVLEMAVDGWNTLRRQSHVYVCGRWVPYPLQLNIHRLPPAVGKRCLEGLLSVDRAHTPRGTVTFDEHIVSTMGEGIAEVFMRPYNYKVWAVPPAMMSSSWIKERVAPVDVDAVRAKMEEHRDDKEEGADDSSWGPNSTFRFPQVGGTGGMYASLYERVLPASSCHVSRASRVVAIEPLDRLLTMADGRTVPYDVLISTMPLDDLLRLIADGLDRAGQLPPPPLDEVSPNSSWLRFSSSQLRALAGQLLSNTTHVVGLGMRGSPPAHLRKTSWLYFADASIPFHRATVFSNYAAANAPPGHWSLMLEVNAHPLHKPVDCTIVVEDCVRGCMAAALLTEGDAIVSRWLHTEEKGYPIPSMGRDAVLDAVQPWLRDCCGIYSRGRFGGWRYEVGNQDHSLMQGVEAVDDFLLRFSPTLSYFTDSSIALLGGEPTYSLSTDLKNTSLRCSLSGKQKCMSK